MQDIPLDLYNINRLLGVFSMTNECLQLFDDFSYLVSNEHNITSNSVFEILKKYSSGISVFDIMDFSSHVIEENKYVHESYREDSEKSYIESFLLRVNAISKDASEYSADIDKESLIEAIEILKSNYENESQKSESKHLLIFYIASFYATFVLEEPIHLIGTPFPGSLKIKEENGKFYCPVKDANLESPNAVCKMCLAKQLDF